MTDSIRSICIGLATAALALALGACNQTTYGTGTTPGMQTIQDLAGIANLGGKAKEPINYSPRPAVVPPPPDTPLPPPGADHGAVAANWPSDPDAEAKRFKDEGAAREKFCSVDVNKNRPECRDPGFRLPPSAQANASRQPSPTLLNMDKDAGDLAHSTAEQNQQAVKLFAEAKGEVAVDENGKPVRRYLTDPPSDYRMPDPTAPVVFDSKPKKKFRWPWEKNRTAAPDNLTPDKAASGTATSSSGGT